MESQTSVEVEINGKKYLFSGVESEEYMQQAASYINKKISEVKKIEGFNRLDEDKKAMIVIVQITDDYYQEKKRADEMEQFLMERDQQLTDLKHELIARQMVEGKNSEDEKKKRERFEKLEQENERLEEELLALMEEKEQLEKELEGSRRRQTDRKKRS